MPKKTRWQLAVIRYLGEVDGPVHGYRISQELGIKSGVLYPMLQRLAEQGLVSIRRDPVQTLGATRKLIRLTRKGEKLWEDWE